MNKRENIHTATGCKRRPVEIQAKEIPSERVTIMARPVLAAVRTQSSTSGSQSEQRKESTHEEAHPNY